MAEKLEKIADEISWGNLLIFPGSEYYRRGIKEGWFTEQQYRERVREGYSYSRINDSLNFTKIPARQLREYFPDF